MSRNIKFLIPCALAFLSSSAPAAKHPSMPEVLAASTPADWRALDPDNTLYVELPGGRVVIELTPRFAPLHVANIKTLTRARYFDSLSIIRVQDNYVVQWGDPDNRHPLPAGIGKVAPEFDSPTPAGMPFTRLPDGDVYAPEAGFSDGLPVARSASLHRSWLAHCYGMVGAGLWNDNERGANMLDGGAHFYGTYQTKDGKFVSVGSIEPQFYALLRQHAGLTEADFDAQMDRNAWPALKQKLVEVFKTKTRDEWCKIMEGTDICFAPVLTMKEAPHHPHMAARNIFVERHGVTQPAPAPRFSRTPSAIREAETADIAGLTREWKNS